MGYTMPTLTKLTSQIDTRIRIMAFSHMGLSENGASSSCLMVSIIMFPLKIATNGEYIHIQTNPNANYRYQMPPTGGPK
jgi:hypothetical protein